MNNLYISHDSVISIGCVVFSGRVTLYDITHVGNICKFQIGVRKHIILILNVDQQASQICDIDWLPKHSKSVKHNNSINMFQVSNYIFCNNKMNLIFCR